MVENVNHRANDTEVRISDRVRVRVLVVMSLRIGQKGVMINQYNMKRLVPLFNVNENSMMGVRD